MRSRLTALTVGVLMAVLGLTAAFIVSGARADGVTLADLPGLGYTLVLRADLSTSPPCSMYWVVGGNGAPETVIGDPNHPSCQPPGAIEQRIAALLAAYPPTPTTTAPLVVTETVHDTTTVTNTATTTMPAETITVAAPPVVRTETETMPLTTTVTVTQIVPVQTPIPDPEWLIALAARSQALNVLYALS